jgi:hypothetical protein
MPRNSAASRMDKRRSSGRTIYRPQSSLTVARAHVGSIAALLGLVFRGLVVTTTTPDRHLRLVMKGFGFKAV